MKVGSIVFNNSSEVCSLLSAPRRRKTQARFPVGARMVASVEKNRTSLDAVIQKCPHGRTGDLLWVRERCLGKMPSVYERLQMPFMDYENDLSHGVFYNADATYIPIKDSKRHLARWQKLHLYNNDRAQFVPPREMPRWASRLTLQITSVRVQRLQDISGSDAVSEGGQFRGLSEYRHRKATPQQRADALQKSAVEAFKARWDLGNANTCWDKNPLVWALTFEVIRANIDQVLARMEAQ